MIPGETPEGWYADPKVPHPAAERWWNGVQWTAHTRLSMPDDVHDRFVPPAPGAPALHSPVLPVAPEPARPAPPIPQRPQSAAATPYGVALAPFGPRIIAFVLDLVIVHLVAFPLGALVGLGLSVEDDVLDVWVPGLVPLLVFWVYHYLTLSWQGATPGQRAVGIGVRPWLEHTRLTPGQLVVRTLVVSVVYLGALLPGMGGVGYFAWLVIAGRGLLVGNSRRGIHETWSETCVVRTR